MIDVVERIRELRLERGWSEYRLAKEAGLSQSTFSNLERRSNFPSIITVEKICNGLDITLSQFFSEDKYNESLLSDAQYSLIKKWCCLSSVQKEKVMIYIDGMLVS